MGVAGHIDAPQHDSRQNRQRQQAANEPQLLADDGEDKVRVAVGQAGAVLALGLYAVEQSHARQLSAAKGHQASGLVPALLHGVEAVVKHHDKAVFHVILDHILLPENVEGQRRRQSAADEPALGHAGHEAHADKDGHKHQITAHIRGNFIVQQEKHHQVRAQKQHVRQLFQRAVLLKPHQLPRQHHREGQLHDLGGLHHEGQEREIQPRQIAGVARLAKDQQQKDHAEAEQRQPQPALFPHQLADIHQRQQEKQNNADHRAAGLHQHQPQRLHIPGGRVDHQNAVGRGGAAKCQQNKICLPQNIP